METIGCLSQQWTEKIGNWIEEMKLLSRMNLQTGNIQAILDGGNIFIEAIVDGKRRLIIKWYHRY